MGHFVKSSEYGTYRSTSTHEPAYYEPAIKVSILKVGSLVETTGTFYMLHACVQGATFHKAKNFSKLPLVNLIESHCISTTAIKFEVISHIVADTTVWHWHDCFSITQLMLLANL